MKQRSFNNAVLHYRVYGAGSPVLLLHGFGEDGDIWQRQVNALQNKFMLIVPDLPGSGQSAMIPDMSIEGMADAVFAIVQAEAIENVIVLGHSMGGYIMLAFAEKYPSVTKAIGLVHSSAFADNEEKKATRRKAISFIEKNGSYDFLKTSIPDLFYQAEDADAGVKEALRSLIEKGSDFAPEALIAYYNAMIGRPDRTAVLRSFPGPVLFIIGRHDKAIPFDQSMQQCYLPDRSDIHILDNSAHMGMIEETGKVNAAIEGFLVISSKY